MSTGDTPLLIEVLDAALEGRLRGVRVHLPGRVEAYDKGRRRATVQLLVQDRSIDGAGELKLTTIAPLIDVPVLFPGSGRTRIIFPIKVGDPCWAMFSSSAIARIKAGSSATAVVDPGDDRHHHEADAVMLPIPPITTEFDDDDALIEFTDDELIRAGGNEPLVTRAEFLAHGHPTAGTGPASAPVVVTPAALAATFPGTPKLRG